VDLLPVPTAHQTFRPDRVVQQPSPTGPHHPGTLGSGRPHKPTAKGRKPRPLPKTADPTDTVKPHSPTHRGKGVDRAREPTCSILPVGTDGGEPHCTPALRVARPQPLQIEPNGNFTPAKGATNTDCLPELPAAVTLPVQKRPATTTHHVQHSILRGLHALAKNALFPRLAEEHSQDHNPTVSLCTPIEPEDRSAPAQREARPQPLQIEPNSNFAPVRATARTAHRSYRQQSHCLCQQSARSNGTRHPTAKSRPTPSRHVKQRTAAGPPPRDGNPDRYPRQQTRQTPSTSTHQPTEGGA
jgi:hypothetical protein